MACLFRSWTKAQTGAKERWEGTASIEGKDIYVKSEFCIVVFERRWSGVSEGILGGGECDE